MRTSACLHSINTRGDAVTSIAFFFSLGALLLSGCGQINSRAAVTSVQPNVLGITGNGHGGQQPVSNAVVQLYAVGTTGDGSAATPLLTGAPVTTDSTGSFNITNRFTCPSPSTLVYIAATGGNPGLGGSTNNSAIAQMSALGQCGTLTPSTFIGINEISTAVSVFALAPYVASVDHIGSGSSDQAALSSAFATISQTLNTTTGNVPGPNLPVGYGVPADQVNTLGNILAACVNSGGGISGDGSPCGTLFQYTGGSTVTNTIAAAQQIAANPSTNTAQLFSLAPSTGPFQPMLTAAPSTFVASVLPAAPPAAITPAGGSSFPITVSIVDSIVGSRVHYTTDGSTPTVSSPLFTTAFSLPASTTVKAIAVASGYADSAVASVGYGASTNPTYTVKTVNVCEPHNVGTKCAPVGVVVNPNTNTVYVSNSVDVADPTLNPSPKAMTIMDGNTDTVSTFVQVPIANPGLLAINPATNKIYLSSVVGFGVGLAALDEATNTTTSFKVNVPLTSLVLNSSTNKIYGLSGGGGGGTLYLVDAISGGVSTISAGEGSTNSLFSPLIDVNPITNHLFVGGSPNVLNIDGATNTVVDAFAAASSAVAVNPVTNKVYIGIPSGVLVYDPATLSTTSVSGTLVPLSIAVNPNTNTIYSLGASSLQVIDGATNTVTTSVSLGTTGNQVSKLVFDPVLNKIYAIESSSGTGTSGLYVLDGATNALSTVATGLTLGNIVNATIHPVTHKLYITDLQSSVIVVIPN
jgi:hypothetical protein